jgi:hypothetical protein
MLPPPRLLLALALARTASAQVVTINLQLTAPTPAPLVQPVHCLPDAAQVGYLWNRLIIRDERVGIQECDAVGGYDGEPTAACETTWLAGDWASVGAGGYDPGGNGDNSDRAQSANIGTYLGAPVTRLTCAAAAASQGTNADGESPNGATWWQASGSDTGGSCYANYRLSYPFTDPSSTQARTTLFSSTNAESRLASGSSCSAEWSAADSCDDCWASCLNAVLWSGCALPPSSIDCVGVWSMDAAECTSACETRTYSVSVEASGTGASCASAHGDTLTCTAGDGACVDTSTTACAGVVCTVSAACRVAGTCVDGVCTAESVAPDGTACDDSDAGTIDDVCTAGVCAGAAAPPVLPPEASNPLVSASGAGDAGGGGAASEDDDESASSMALKIFGVLLLMLLLCALVYHCCMMPDSAQPLQQSSRQKAEIEPIAAPAEGEGGGGDGGRDRAATEDALADIDDLLVGLDPSMRLSGIQQQQPPTATALLEEREPPPLPQRHYLGLDNMDANAVRTPHFSLRKQTAQNALSCAVSY